MIAIPEIDLVRIRRWANGRVPERVRGQIRIDVEVDSRAVTILECRPPWRENFGPEWSRFPIARFRYVAECSSWTLYWRDRNLAWHLYDRAAPSARIDSLIDEVDADPTHIFWG